MWSIRIALSTRSRSSRLPSVTRSMRRQTPRRCNDRSCRHRSRRPPRAHRSPWMRPSPCRRRESQACRSQRDLSLRTRASLRARNRPAFYLPPSHWTRIWPPGVCRPLWRHAHPRMAFLSCSRRLRHRLRQLAPCSRQQRIPASRSRPRASAPRRSHLPASAPRRSRPPASAPRRSHPAVLSLPFSNPPGLRQLLRAQGRRRC